VSRELYNIFHNSISEMVIPLIDCINMFKGKEKTRIKSFFSQSCRAFLILSVLSPTDARVHQLVINL
jgi:hypothetical protein